MMKLLKLGMGAIFLVIMVVVVFWMFFVDVFVENIIESKGTDIVGAKVELEEADLSLFPSGLTLTHLQATDPDEPMTNAVDIARIAMSLDVIPLLWSKVIVEEMSVEGVQFGTERKTSGAILGSRVPQKTEESSSFILPSLEVPDVKKVLEQEDLVTVKLIDTLKADIQIERNIWKARLKDLPGKAEFKKYKQRVKQLKKSAKGGIGGILSGVDEVQSIKKEIEVDATQMKEAQKEFQEKMGLLKTRLSQIKTAPQRDVQHLKKKYNLSAEGLSNVSQILFGKQVGPWVRQGLAWYERLKPYLEQGQGTVESSGSSDDQGIDFLIRLAKISMVLDAGQLAGTIHNITPAQAVFGKPLTFTFSGEKLKGLSSLTLEGTLDHRQASRSSDQVKFHAKGYQLQNMTLSQDKKWPVTLSDGSADVNVTAELQGQTLTARGKGLLNALHISAGVPNDSNPLTQSLSQAISGVSRVVVNADVTGTVDQYDVALQSDLDDILQKAAGKMVSDVAGKFSQKLQDGILAKTAKPIKDLKKNLGSLGPVGSDLASRLAQNDQLLQDLFKQKLPKKLLPDGLLPF
ncbi:MAG: TIGR03545 family protein [Nitrospirales bacterium]